MKVEWKRIPKEVCRNLIKGMPKMVGPASGNPEIPQRTS